MKNALKSLLAIYGVLLLSACENKVEVTTPTTPKLDRFENIVNSGVLRCGYQYWDGGLYQDDQTGELKGFMVDVTEALGTVLDLKIEWTAVIDWGLISTELNTNKIDTFCAAVWLSGKNTKTMLVSDAIAYNGFEAFVRGDDNRFDNDWRKLNDPSVIMAIIENTSSGFISQRILPNASPYGLPPIASTDLDLALNVATGKADVAFTNPGILVSYMKQNPGNIKRVRPGEPFAYMGLTYPVQQDSFRTLHMINTGIKELQNTGVINQLIEKYNVSYPEMFLESAGS
ncbi:MAG: transporter substrate-binding domain-containing protein [Gammaproteobacteria bacterium]|nr:transporter substrate-binding domain-containing protein [Gammaproteobacteria bacterium]